MVKRFAYRTLNEIYNYDRYLKRKDTYHHDRYNKTSLKTIKEKDYPAYLFEGSNLIIGEIHEVAEITDNSLDKLEGYWRKITLIMNTIRNYLIFIIKMLKNHPSLRLCF